MSKAREDILVDIPDEDLPKLAKMYEEHKEWAPHAYSTITTGIEWKKSENGKYMTFMSPNNCWKDDGTFFAVLEYYSFDIFVFTLDESGKNVYEALMKTRRLETNFSDRARLFYSVHNKLYPVVERFVKEKKMELAEVMPCYLYSIPKEEALKFDIECPPDVYIQKLDKSHANILNEKWPHRYINSEKYVALVAEMNGAYGVFLKSSDQLVSWGLVSLMGQLAVVQTADGHKRKGYASLITKCPPDLYIKKLDKSHASIVNENWPHRYKDSQNYIGILTEMNGAHGVFLKSNDKLVAWGVISLMGQLAMVQTADGHKKKGYASLIVKYLSKELAKKGHNAAATVLKKNTIAQLMFDRLGFRSVAECTFALFL